VWCTVAVEEATIYQDTNRRLGVIGEKPNEDVGPHASAGGIWYA
jgi:hypothetical protein